VKLASVIATEFDEEWYRADLASIVGDRSDDELAAWIDALCRAQLGREIIDARFASKSVGAVFGLTLAGGANVVLKLFPQTFSEAELRAIERCLAHANASGYPAPKQLGPLVRTEHAWAAFYELVHGVVLDAHVPAVRRRLACVLADLTGVMTGVDAGELPLAAARGATLWPPPHRVAIDLSIPGGEWIDARAAAAQRVIRAAELPLVVAHMDWQTSHVLFDGDRIAAVIDWDSLARASEAEMIGRAAAVFTVNWSTHSALPTRDEASAFVHEYATARGRHFDAIDYRVINASADYVLAQVGRHGHSAPGCADDEFRALLRTTAAAPLVRATR
jgi:hypothetical protein